MWGWQSPRLTVYPASEFGLLSDWLSGSGKCTVMCRISTIPASLPAQADFFGFSLRNAHHFFKLVAPLVHPSAHKLGNSLLALFHRCLLHLRGSGRRARLRLRGRGRGRGLRLRGGLLEGGLGLLGLRIGDALLDASLRLCHLILCHALGLGQSRLNLVRLCILEAGLGGVLRLREAFRRHLLRRGGGLRGLLGGLHGGDFGLLGGAPGRLDSLLVHLRVLNLLGELLDVGLDGFQLLRAYRTTHTSLLRRF
mmetsp:Transcript_20558/g.66607  ORF Transcript_20558/g.66607 Transcript_20558/m.66607 type:complete len:252 (-) Transcript_20558:653-1408(-)